MKVPRRYVFLPDNKVAPSPFMIGGKALGLFRLLQTNCNVPPWFAVTSEAWTASMKAGQDPEGAERPGANTEFPAPLPEVVADIDEAVRRLGLSGAVFAVRSSARVEDGSEHSFAGQFATILHVRSDELAAAVGRVWASAETVHCRKYALQNNVPLADLVPAVVVQEMVTPDISGVLFTADPVSGSREVSVIAALSGLGEGIVGGSCTPDTYTVEKSGRVVKREIPHKEYHIVYDENSRECCRVAIPEDLRDAQVCSDEVLSRLAALGDRIAESLGGPQDIEWCLQGARIDILQARPITALQWAGKSEEKDEEIRIWDNANIVESYPGISLPLTFSFIDPMYAGVYRRMCQALGLRESYLAKHPSYFRMLGYFRGRVYYNLLNWYRLLALLPGSRHHRRYFNEMLGIGEEVDEADLPPSRRLDGLRAIAMVGRLTVRFILLPVQVRRFLIKVRKVREQADAVDLESLGLIDLVEQYHRLEHLLLRRWITPQFNDFYCQTFTGLLKAAISRWLGAGHVASMHELLPVGKEVESERAVTSLRDLASMVRDRPKLLESCQSDSPPDLLHKLREDAEIRTLFDKHVKSFGDRWQGELKLETLTPADDPVVLVEVLASHVLAPPERRPDERESALRAALVELPILRRGLINLLARVSRRLIANRENTRFERTRVFGLVRRIFRAIGRRLVERGHLTEVDDVFYLTKDEVFGLIEGTVTDLVPSDTVRRRRQAADAWRSQPAPGRFRSRGLLIEHGALDESGSSTAPAKSLRGMGSSPGVVRARVRVINSPGDLGDARGCIIAAESTDPGWSFIFPLVSGVLVERGSLLSHAAIVAREMRIPAIVGIEGLMQRLPDGAYVELDGNTGTVTVLEGG